MTEQCDIAIIGAGAAGMAAGIFAAEAARDAAIAPPRILLLDGAKTIGAKILVSGGGRCNVTHDEICPEDYNGPRTIVRNVLAAFDEQAAVRWMESMGVPLKREETGKLFPVSDSARTVLNALLNRLNKLGVEVRAGCRAAGLKRQGDEMQGALQRQGDSETWRPGDDVQGHGDTATERHAEGETERPGQGDGGLQNPTGPPAPDPESMLASRTSPIANLPVPVSPCLPIPVSPCLPVPVSPCLPISPSLFVVRHSTGELHARCVILCTGGRSLPRTGSDGFGWEIVRRLGHTVTDTYPALVPLVLADSMFHARVSGLSHEAELVTLVDGKRVDRRTGSLLWTHFGISGPVVMDASRFWTIAHGKSLPVELRCSFVPGQSFEKVEQDLIRIASARPRLSVVKAAAEYLPERLAEAILQHIGTDPALPLAQLSREARRKLIHALTSLPLPVTRDRGWNYAEVTAGGVPLDEVDFRTLASRKVPGLFLAGEILDCDGRIGGFNFQWAWATGYLAGRAAVNSCTDSRKSVR